MPNERVSMSKLKQLIGLQASNLSVPKSAAPQEWDLKGLSEALVGDFAANVDPAAWLAAERDMEEPALRQRLVDAVSAAYEAKVARIGAPIMRHVEKDVMLRTLDRRNRR